MKTAARVFFAAILVLVVLPRWGETCAPEFPQLVFTRPMGPDAPMAKFARGRIGIPLPTWLRAHLVVAFRYLAGKPLSLAEQRSLLEFFDHEHELGREVSEQAAAPWLQERAKYRGGTPPKISPYHPGRMGYLDYVTCLPPAFDNAVRTLHVRAQQFGSNSPELQEWITGQDEVFENCSGGPSVPANLPANANPLLRADRAYQIAAADFYIPDLASARREFEAIARDNSSPWREIAPYMIARTVIRLACCIAGNDGIEDQYNPAILKEAEALLQRIIANPQQRVLRRDAERLQALVEFHLHPEQRQHELGRILVSGRSGSEFGQHLVDYTWLLDRFFDVASNFVNDDSWGLEYVHRVREWKIKQYQQLRNARSDELSDWLITVQSGSDAARLHAVSMWQSTHSIPWLFAAMVKLRGTDENTPKVLEAAALIPKSSPAFTALAFHRSRLLRESGQLQAARVIIEEALQLPASLSTVNLLKDEQLRNSANPKELQSRMVRVSADLSNSVDPDWEDFYCDHDRTCNIVFYGVAHPKKNAQLLPQFDQSVAEVVNRRLPVDLSSELAASSSLPANLQIRLAPAVWARAVLLGNVGAAQRVAEATIKARPELSPSWKRMRLQRAMTSAILSPFSPCPIFPACGHSSTAFIRAQEVSNASTTFATTGGAAMSVG